MKLRDRLDALKACSRSAMHVICLLASYTVYTIFQTGFSIKQTSLLHHAYISQRIFVGEACTNNAKTDRVCRKHSLSTSLDSHCSYIRFNFKKQDKMRFTNKLEIDRFKKFWTTSRMTLNLFFWSFFMHVNAIMQKL